MNTITRNVLDYQEAREGLDALVQQVSELVYRYPVGRCGLSQEDSAEFLLNFYPRISGLIERYREQGTTFESYLAATLRWQLRTFAATRAAERIRSTTAAGRDTASEIVGHDIVTQPSRERRSSSGDRAVLPAPATRRPAHRPSSLRLHPRGPDGLRLTPGEAQRLLCLALKTRGAFATGTLERVATMVGCKPAWLEERFHELRLATEQTRAKREQLRIRRDQAWFRLRCIETRILQALPAELPGLVEQRERWHHRYERARALLERMPSEPTHAQIADVLGLKKGTVDSSVYKIRQELRNPRFRDRLARLLEQT